jgi:hypothetical protein
MHLQNFLEIGSTISIKNIPMDTILLRLFPFSLTGNNGSTPMKEK